MWTWLLAAAHATVVNCGDTLTADTTLSADIVCPVGFAGDAVTMGADNITPDGNGFTLSLVDGTSGAAGVRIDVRTGVTVTNLAIQMDTDGGTGVIATGTTDLTLSGNTIDMVQLGSEIALDLNGGLNSIVDGNTVTGSGRAVLFTNETAPVLQNNSLKGHWGVRLVDTPIWLDGADNNTFLDPPGLVTGGYGHVVIESDDVILTNLDLSAAPDAIDRTNAIEYIRGDRVQISGCDLSNQTRGFYTNGFSTTGGTDLILDDNLVLNASIEAITLHYTPDVVLTNNVLQGSDEALLILDGMDGFQLLGSLNNDFTQLEHPSTLSGSCIVVDAPNVVIDGVTCTTTTADTAGTRRGTGVSALGLASGLQVRNSSFEGYSRAVSVFGDDVLIEGNTMDSSYLGIRLLNAVNTVIQDNTFDLAHNRGIEVASSVFGAAIL